MRLNRGPLLVTGIAAIIAAIALAGASFSGLPSAFAGVSSTPEFTPEFTPATCVPGQTCPTSTPQEPRTHTPTPEPTEGPTDTAVPVTDTPAPPPPTNTPTGGTQAGGIQPPSTGTGPGDVDGQPWLLIAAGAALAIFGVSATAVGLKRR